MNKFSQLFLVALLVSTSALAAATPDHFSFEFDTTQGKMQFDCPQGWAPLGEQRLYELITTDFFTDIAFFRVIDKFVAQFGISGDPAVAAKWNNANLVDDPVVGSNLAGTLTFATAGPGTRTTQLFINLVDNVRLDAMGFSPICKMANADSLAVAKKLYSAYGEGAPDGKGPNQDLITQQGSAYLKNYPLLDYIRSAVLE